MSKTGRYYVKDLKTGRTFVVEPIGETRTGWGDVNPTTKKVEGDYGQKYQGSVDPEDSIINEEDFKNVIELKPGENPMDYINKLLDHEEGK